MIGVAVSKQDAQIAEEFFELFKTPWEWVVPGKRYGVILAANTEIEHSDADLFIVYGSGECLLDCEAGIHATPVSGPVSVEWQQWSLPICGGVALLESHDGGGGLLNVRGKSVDCRFHREGRVIRRIGYNLFDEVRCLLATGQPVAHALTPTLELHIALLRYLLIDSKIPFVEILPRPAGYDFICCLTHDVDFFGIRRQRFDRTMAGFLYRSSIGSLIDWLRGRRTLAEMCKNWWACCSLPFVFAGLCTDFWRPFKDYADIEDPRKSTFFLLPFRGIPGVAPDGTTKAWRAAPYGISDVQEEVRDAACRGSEIGLHGIDAWRESDAGNREMKQVTSLTEKKPVGIRMHWLYFDGESPSRLEKAGFDYDSTCGYNETVGYRAGTAQAFRPLGCTTLMELPMLIMDSALFSRERMNLHWRSALQLCEQVVNNARRFGGTLVINWHERSLVPERLWGNAYRELLEMISTGEPVWFATAGEAVQWFRWRRSIRFDANGPSAAGDIHVTAPTSMKQGAVARIFSPGRLGSNVKDVSFDGTASLAIAVST